jgi:iron complex outermembrane receptor protein
MHSDMSTPASSSRALVFAALVAGSTSIALGQAVRSPADQTRAPSEEVIELGTFEVRSEGHRGYGSTHALGAARLNTLVIDTPMSVVTLNGQFLRDTGVTDWVQAAKYVSGVNLASSSSRTGQISLRGYNTASFANYRDGLADPGFDIRGQAGFDPATVARLEVIKGAAGVLYGSHSLGGVVNRVSKMPLTEDRTTLGMSTGSFGFSRFDVDTSQVLTDRVRFRLVGAYQKGQLEWGGWDDRRVFNPIVSITLQPGMEAWFRLDYQRMYYSGQASSWFTDSQFNMSTFVPRGSNLDEINDQADHRRLWMYEAGLRANFTWREVDFASRLVYRRNDISYNNAITDKTSFTLIDATGTPLRNAANQVRTLRNTTFAEMFALPGFHDIRVGRQTRLQGDTNTFQSLNLDLVGDFSVGPTQHKALSYLSFTKADTSSYVDVVSLPPRDVFRPVNVVDVNTIRGPRNANIRNTTQTDPYNWSWGLTDQVSFFEQRLFVVVGARYDSIQTKGQNLLTGAQSQESVTNWSYRYGGVYKPVSGVALFANYSETFSGGAQGVDSFGNRPPATIDGTSKEVGVKLDLWDSQLVFTGSVFDMELAPFVILELVPGTSDRRFVNAGSNTTRGWEADVAWQPHRTFTLIAGFGDLTSRDRLDRRFRHVAEGFNYRAFGKYEFPEGPLDGLSIGLGYHHTPARAADAGDNFTLPAFSQMDGFVSYRWRDFTARISGTNLQDKYVPVYSINRDRITTIDPRTLRFAIEYEF